MAHCRKLFIGACLFLLVILLAACRQTAGAPAQPTKTGSQDAFQPSVIEPTRRTTARVSQNGLPTLRPSSTPLPSPTIIPSFTPYPTATFAPTRTASAAPTKPGEAATAATATAFPPLKEGRPFLVYFQVVDGHPAIVLVNADASGKRVLPLPANSQPLRLPEALSPNGEWLAFHTGTAGTMYGGQPAGGKYDLALNLMHLPDGKVTEVSPLLSKDFPAGLKTIAEQLAAKESKGGSTQDELHLALWNLFLRGINSLAWSPNGRQLAFAGEMQGPGSDLYIYNLDTRQIRRMTEGNELIQWILWSPDGGYILHSRANRQCEGECDTKQVLDINSGKTWIPTQLKSEGGMVVIFDWAGPHALTFYTAANGIGQGFLKNIDLLTDQATDLYPSSFKGFVIDPEKNVLLLSLMDDYVAGKSLDPGLYLYHPDSSKRELVASVAQYGQLGAEYWGQGTYRFILWSKDKVYGMAADGKMTQLVEGTFAGLARNNKTFAVIGKAEDKPALLQINEKGEVVHQANTDFAGSLIWAPDSSGVFSLSDNGLAYLDWASGRWTLVDATLTPKSWAWTNVWPYAWKK